MDPPYGNGVRDEQDYFGKIGDGTVNPDPMKLATKLVEERPAPWDPKVVADPVQERLLDIMAAKKKGRKRPARAKTEASASTAPALPAILLRNLKRQWFLKLKPNLYSPEDIHAIRSPLTPPCRSHRCR